MKVNGTSGVGSATGARGARPGGGGPGFQLPSIGGASGAGQSSSVSASQG
jgi:hypothetical protein